MSPLISSPATPTSLQERLDFNSPFNQYNTEFVKLDVYDWNEISNLIDPNARFTLLSPEDETLIDCPMASDSINVVSFI